MKKKSKSRMAAKLKHGGQTLTHGGYSFLAKGTLPEHRKYILRYLTAAREGLVRDLGPTEDNLTTAQIILIDRIVSKLGVIRCIEEHTRENGVFRGSNLAPALGMNYISWNNSVRIDLDKLGIHKRVADNVPDIQDYIKSKYGKKKK